MGIYDKLKKLVNNFFGFLEVTTINFAVKTLYNWNLEKKYMKNTDSISLEYKEKIQEYWSPYIRSINPRWHKYYSSRNNICDVRYIPDDLYYTKIDQYFNNRKYGWGVNDKNYYSLWFPEIKQPETVLRKINGIYYDSFYNILTEEEALTKCSGQTELIIKPSVETGGSKGIKFWENSQGVDKFKEYISLGQDNIIVQQMVQQHLNLSEIHSTSLNTVRIITLLFKNEVYILSSVLRMGVDGSKVDNASAGGITCGIKKDGSLKDVAYTAHGEKYLEHPQGFKFNNGKVPSYDKIKHMVVEQQEKMAHFRLISWDIGVQKNGEPVFIEANLRNGELDFHQFNNGPLFGELTEEILEEVFSN